MYADRLSEMEWQALVELSKSIGEEPIVAALNNLEVRALRTFCQKAMVSIAQSQSVRPSSSHSLKLETSEYKGGEGEALLRWFVELETAINARDIVNPARQVAFAMSRLGGRAKSWAYGKRLSDPSCFPDYSSFKKELRAAFEPPKTEFRTRSEFFSLSQGKRDVLSYAQRARYLISCITEHPIDTQSQVVVFMKGLNDGPVRTELYRQFPTDLEAAITLALQEDFSLKQARFRVGFQPSRSKPFVPHGSSGRQQSFRSPQNSGSQPEPMDISMVTTSVSPRPFNQKGRTGKPIDKSTITCRRCWKKGHFPSECRAPAPVERPAHVPAPGSQRLPPKNH
jgi:hypothetical protein